MSLEILNRDGKKISIRILYLYYANKVAQSLQTISNRMSSISEIQQIQQIQQIQPTLPPPSTQKIVEVEAADEGPKVKAKRVLTEAQLEALKRGREKLAEKRRQLAEEKENEVNNQPVAETQPLVEQEDETYPGSFCTIV